MAPKTAAQWRREVPAYDRLIRVVEDLTARWPGAGRVPRVIAHLNPNTKALSIVLDGTPDDCEAADLRLGPAGYRSNWVLDTTVRPVWRKAVSS